MRIEKIQPSPHKRERVLVFLEDGTLLRLTAETVVRFDLHPGQELTQGLREELEQAQHAYQIRSHGARMASERMLSKQELQRRLERKGANEQEAAETADWLEELGAVDDGAYAAAIVQHYSRMGYGALRIRQELQRRGIPRELWEEALCQLPHSGETIRALLHSKTKGKPLDREQGRKLAAMLQRRGFTWQEIRPELSAFLDGETLPEE